MTKWSGLAPAVDAHLARWSISKRVADITSTPPEWLLTGRRATEKEEQDWVRTTVQSLARTDAGMRWLTFAKSYGLPSPDGGAPRPSFDFLDPVARETVVTNDEATITGKEKFEHTQQSLVSGTLLIQREFKMLDAAVSHYVSQEVVSEVGWAAEEAFPEPLFETDLFTPAGFAVLEQPINVVDLHPETGMVEPRLHIQVRAIGWHRHGGIMSPLDRSVGEGVSLFLYTTPDDYINGYCKEAAALGFPFKDPAADADVEGPFIPVEVIPWRFGVEWSPRSDDVNYHVPGTVPTPVAFQRRWFFAFMRLCWQDIIVRHTDHEPRHNHRRWERMAKRKELLDYTTLRLRRVVDPNYEPSGMGVPLDHRVKVRAHWRRQWIQSLGPARLPDGTMDPTTHRLIWIEEHFRGPEDGPIGALHSATSVIR